MKEIKLDWETYEKDLVRSYYQGMDYAINQMLKGMPFDDNFQSRIDQIKAAKDEPAPTVE